VKPGDKLLINGTVQCGEREMPYLAHNLKAEVLDILEGESYTFVAIHTGVEDLDALDLWLDVDNITIVPDPNWRDRILAFPITL